MQYTFSRAVELSSVETTFVRQSVMLGNVGCVLDQGREVVHVVKPVCEEMSWVGFYQTWCHVLIWHVVNISDSKDLQYCFSLVTDLYP